MPPPAPPLTRSSAARDAFGRLLGRCAVILRCGCAVAFAVAVAVGRPSWTGAAVAVALAGWAAITAVPALRQGWRPWMVAGDVLIAAAVSVLHGELVPAAALTDTTGWVFLVASTAVIVSQLGVRAWPGVLATLTVPVGYAAGLALTPSGAPGSALLLVVQGVLLGALMVPLRRAAAVADAAIDSREEAERAAAVGAARRAEEREHDRLLHDSVSATLTVIAAGGIRGSVTLRAQARRDLSVLDHLGGGPALPALPALPAGGGDGVGAWLEPVLAATGPEVAVRAVLGPHPVPPGVGAAIAAAVAEALRNAARHAAGARVRLSARSSADGVLVEVHDDGPGFDPAAVPASRRGVRDSLVGRMADVGGSAHVDSAPGAGTRVRLHWPAAPAVPAVPAPAAPAVPAPAVPAPAGPAVPAGPGAPGAPGAPEREMGEEVARSYSRGMSLAVVWLVGVWHVTSDLTALVSWAPEYRSLAAEVVAWLALAAVAVVGGVRELRGAASRAWSWSLAAAVLAASALATAMVPGPALFAGAGWAWGSAGWFGLLVLLHRPPAELLALVAANSAITFAVLAQEGMLDRDDAARFGTVVYGTAALQLTVALTARALDATGRRAASVAAAEAAVRRRRQVADELHAGRQERYGELRRSVEPLLSGLADGTLDPADPAVRHRGAVAASRLRRLFAETDDVPDPLLHELRACADIADRRGVLVDLQVRGRPPALDVAARRSLTEAPLLALAAAERHARVTVVARSDEVAVGVLADAGGEPSGGPGEWVEARWRR